MSFESSRFAGTTLIGESFVGSGRNAAHLNVVIGRKGGPVETAWVTSLATPRQGHVPVLVTLRPNLPVKPMTLFVNKAEVRGETHETLTLGSGAAPVLRRHAGARRDRRGCGTSASGLGIGLSTEAQAALDAAPSLREGS